MKQQLREALEAVKQGNEEKARILLAEFLRDEPDNVPAWVLMSKLATSQGQKVAFLRKILSLDPEHTYAREQLAASGAAQPQIAQPEAEAPPPFVDAGEAAEAADDLEDAEDIPQIAEEPEPPEEFAPEEVALEMEGDEEEEALAEESADFFPEEEEDMVPEAPAVEPPPMVHTDDAVEVPEVMESEEIGEGAEPPAPAVLEQDEEEDVGEIDWDRFLRDEAGVDVFDEKGQEDVAMPASEDPSDYEAQAEGNTVPPWMDQGETLMDERFPAEGEQEAEEEEPGEEEIPEWLHEPPDDSWLAEPSEEEKEAAAEKEAKIAAAMAASPDRPAQAEGTNTMLVGVLAVLAILVFLALVYAAIVLL